MFITLRPWRPPRNRARVNPIRDLRPVYPNCHAVIHSATPPRTLEEVSRMIRDCRLRQRGKKGRGKRQRKRRVAA
jgi:hypothetical protein